METPIDGPSTIFRKITGFRFQQLRHIEQEGSSRCHGYNPEEEEVHHCHDRVHGHRRLVGTLRPRPRVDFISQCADLPTGRLPDTRQDNTGPDRSKHTCQSMGRHWEQVIESHRVFREDCRKLSTRCYKSADRCSTTERRPTFCRTPRRACAHIHTRPENPRVCFPHESPEVS